MPILFLVTALANAIWQPVLIAGMTWLALRLSQCSNATTRHAVWTVALVASAIVPIVSAVPVLRAEQHTVNNFSIPYTGPIKTSGTHLLPPPHRSVQPTQTQPGQSVLPQITRAKFQIPQSLAFWVAGVWLVAALAILVRLAVSFFYLERLKHDALPFPVDRRNLLARWDRAEKGSRDVRICVTNETSVPIAVGIFDAMILLPSDLVDELDANDLDRILLHELAHVRRSDDWVNLFERIALALMFFSPGMYLIARQMDLEREVACDDWVLEQAAENVPYAKCLARIVEMTQWPYRAMAAPGVFVTRKSMSIRIERLLARGRDIRIRLALVPSLISLVAIVAIVVAGGLVSPTIAYTLNQDVPSTSSVVNKVMPPRTKQQAAFNAVVSGAISAAFQTPQPATPKPVTHQVEHMQTRVEHQLQVAVNQATAPKASIALANDSGYLDELSSAGMKDLTPDEVISMKSVGVTGDYIRAMRAAGLTDLSARTLVELRSVGVTPEYMAAMRAYGFGASSGREWSELKSVGASTDYINQLSKYGIRGLSIQEVVELKSVGVDPQYINEMRGAGLAVQSAHEWTEMKSVGVTPEYVADLARAGYSHLSVHEYVELKSTGIDSAFIAKLASHGIKNLTVHQLIEYKSLGIEK